MFRKWFAKRRQLKKLSSERAEFLMENAVKILKHQLGPSTAESILADPFAVGWIHGCAHAVSTSLSLEGPATVGVTLGIFQAVFGDKPGAVLWARSNELLRDGGSQDWKIGRQVGSSDTERFFARLDQTGQAIAPRSLGVHLFPHAFGDWS
jgi:hypothetical protein